MARKVVISLVDDVDGTSTADETVVFGLDGLNYEIDLTSAHAEKLRALLAQWIPHARRIARRGDAARAKSAAPVSGRHGDLAIIRSWANANGYTVASRGRVPADVVEAYKAAHA
ncbi:histone-like nucleoid-structuring protein Lsr2 [Nocardia thailandica]